MFMSKTLFDIIILVLHVVVIVEAKSVYLRVQQDDTSGLPISPWLRRVVVNQREPGCSKRPWICKQGEDLPKVRRMCCKNQCIEVSSDVNNCGLCGFRCPFAWQCCRGLCVNTNVNPFNCGKCEHKCPFPGFCFYGMCGYAGPPVPFPPKPPLPPFPFPPKPPLPPFPFPPKPPRPPFPFPPKPPLPPFPFPPKPPRPPFSFPPKPPRPPFSFPPKPPHRPFPFLPKPPPAQTVEGGLPHG